MFKSTVFEWKSKQGWKNTQNWNGKWKLIVNWYQYVCNLSLMFLFYEN
jgi:hypothetical protein